jgi:hypothetical protein
MCILFGIGILTNFQNSKLLNLANFCEESWHTPLRYMVCAAIANVSYHISCWVSFCDMHIFIICTNILQSLKDLCWKLGDVSNSCTNHVNRHRTVLCKINPSIWPTPQNHPNFLVPSLDGLQKFQFILYIEDVISCWVSFCDMHIFIICTNILQSLKDLCWKLGDVSNSCTNHVP